ncbi:hypothetical protein IT417_00940 [bacterium]|nr:hypothetical protein [bacterium]
MFKLVARLLYVATVSVQALIVLRISLIFFNIPDGGSIVNSILRWSGYFVSPFKGVLDFEVLQINVFRLELVSVVALFFYLIIGYVVIEMVKAFSTD